MVSRGVWVSRLEDGQQGHHVSSFLAMESDSDDHGDQQSEIDSDESNKSFDYLSNGEDEVLNLRKEEFSLNVMVLKLLMKIIMKLVMQKELPLM
ncbi:hypothetical protein Tco_1038036 [Tanacetum coccineum]